MVIELCDKLLVGTEKQREISSISLKTILCEVPTSLAKPVLAFITPKLIKGIAAVSSYILSVENCSNMLSLCKQDYEYYVHPVYTISVYNVKKK